MRRCHLIFSGRLSLLYYDNFYDTPLPHLRHRIKIDLRTQRIAFIDRTDVPSPQVPLMKSRYMSSDQPRYDEQRRFDDRSHCPRAT